MMSCQRIPSIPQQSKKLLLCRLLLCTVAVQGSWWRKKTRKSSINAFFYYQNAECIDDYHIQGTAVLSFDDDAMNAKYGHVIQNFAGPCRYFKGGSVDVYKSNLFGSKVNDIYQKGYCTENCSSAGHVGCSINGSCSTFMNFARKRSTTTKTTTTGETKNAMNATNATNTTEEAEASAYQLTYGSSTSSRNADSLQRSFLQVLSGSTTAIGSDDDGVRYYLLGGSISLVVLVLLVVVLEKLRQRRVARDAPLLHPVSST